MKPLKSFLQKKPLIAGILFHAILIALFLVAANGVYSTIRYGVHGHKGAKVYYDAVHGARRLWNRDNRRYRSDYHSISGFFRFFRSMEQEGFKPRAEAYNCFNRSILNRYDVYFVGEQTYQGRFMTEEEQKTLIDWVEDGGGLFVLAEHTDAHYMDELVNELFKIWSRPAHYNFLLHIGNVPSMDLATKALTGHHTAYAHWTKEPQLNPWTHKELKPAYDALFLSGPTVPYSVEQLAVIEDYLRRGKTVTYMAPIASLDSEAA
jgi:hypothetical protein